MALQRPEGLAPCYNSLASPDISDSHEFRWTFRGVDAADHQTKYTLELRNSTSDTLKTVTVVSPETRLRFEDFDYPFEIGETYYWNIVAYGRQNIASRKSVNAMFYYDSCPEAPSFSWLHIPKAGDVVVSDTYFEEMKTNIQTLMDDYDGVSSSLSFSLSKLFTREVVPSRQDFRILEDIIDFLSTRLEDSYAKDIDGPVRDGLGISDLENIRKHIDMLTTVRPRPIGFMSINAERPGMYAIQSLTTTSDNLEDPTIDLRWTVGSTPSYSGTFDFLQLSPSKDIRYYRARFEYGPSSAPFASDIYFHADNLWDGAYRRFDTDWDGLYTPETIGFAKQSLQVYAVDKRGNSSSPKTVTKTYGTNFRAPLGVRYYEAEVQRAVLGDSAPDPNGKWWPAYSGGSTSATYRISGGEGRIYFRVRAVDYSGLTTGWFYEDGINFDPLTPPATPRLSYTSTTTSSKVDWAATARAEYYEWKMWSGGTVTTTTATEFTKTGLGSARMYTFYVRAGNRAGWSSWSGIQTTTKTARKTTERAMTAGKSWNQKLGWNSTNGKKYVMQGEWCEIEGSPNQIKSVPAGHCWGGNKGMWVFDSAYWRSVLSGKKIIKVQVWVQRQGGQHGYYNDQVPTFWLHNYTGFPSGQPMFASKFHPGKEFDLGESGWVTLPNYYGEYIRDNKAKGIGVFRSGWGKLPYIKFYQNAKLRITYE